MDGDESDVRAEVRALRSELAAVDERLSALEEALDEREGAAGVGDEPTAKGNVPSAPSATQDASDAEPDEENGVAVAPDPAGTPETPAGTDSSASNGRNWEVNLGVRWLGVVGVVALVVGVALFVRHAIQQNLVGYFARVVLGASTGVVMVGGGRYAARETAYERWGKTVTGGGLAIAYLSIYAAYGFDAYREAIGTSLGATLALLTVVVGAGVSLSIRDETRLIAAESFLLGYVTAVLAAELGDFTLAYALVLTLGLAAVAVSRGWTGLALGGVFGSYAVYAFWLGDQRAATVLGGVYLVAVLASHLAVSLVPVHRTAAAERWTDEALLAANALAFALFFDTVVEDVFVDARPIVFLALAGLYAGVLFATERFEVRERTVTPYLSVLFAVVAVFSAVGTFWETIVLAAFATALVVGSFRSGRPHVRRAAHGVVALLVAKVLLFDASELPAFTLETPLSPNRLYAFLAVAGSCYLLYGLFERRDNSSVLTPESELQSESGFASRLPTPPVAAGYAWVGTALAVVVLALELTQYWLSAVWAAYALALLGVGLSLRESSLRFQAIALFGLTTAKVFLFDTSELDPLARTLSFLTLGIVLLVAAFAYARFADRRPVAG